MTHSRHLHAIGAALALAAFVATGAASARPAQQSMLPTIGRAECAKPAAVLASLHASDSQASPARTSAPSAFDDYIEDVVTAPDICAANLVTNDNVAITLGVHIHDRSAFDATDTYRIHLDTDSNPATGSPAEAGPLVGADFVIDIADQTVLSAWNGSSFAAVAPPPEVLGAWVDGYGPAVLIDRAALGNPQALNVVLSTGNGADRDLAPDSGSWSYVIAPLRLAAGRLTLSPARAGVPLLAVMEVVRSDFDIPLDEGAIACRGSLAGKKLTGRGRFMADLVTCVWRLPKGSSGKRLSGSVSVTFQSVVAKRSFGIRVK